MLAYLSDASFDLYFDRFTLDNATTEEAKDYDLVKEVMLEKLSTQNTEFEIMREALTFRYNREDIPTSYQERTRSTIKRKQAITLNSSYSEML